MRRTRARTAAAILVAIAVPFYLWGNAEAQAARRDADACFASAPGVPLADFGCGFLVLGGGWAQTLISFALIGSAAIILAFERWKQWRADRPMREAAAIDREIAAIDAELARIEAGEGRGD